MVGTQFPGVDPATGTPTPGFEKWVHDPVEGAYKLRYLINGSGGTISAGQVFKQVYDGDEETNPKAVACTATATLLQEVVVFHSTPAGATTLADGLPGWFVAQGYCDAFVEGTTDVTKDDFLKIVVGTDADAFVDDTTARTVNSFAIACEDQTANSAVLTKVYMFGERAVIS